MKVLIVCSATTGKIVQFIKEQTDSLQKIGVEIEFQLVHKKGLFGYLQAYTGLIKTLRSKKYDLIHAHYGLSGMISVLQGYAPSIITFHGCDVNQIGFNYYISKLAERLCNYSIYVNSKLAKRLCPKNSFSVISCGVDLEKNYTLDKTLAREKLNIDLKRKFVLFSSDFSTPVKNYSLAREVIDSLDGVDLIELKNYSRDEVTLLMNAADCLLVTSLRESGPLVVKEALACGCPIVSVDVGDVREVIGSINGCYLTSYDPKEISSAIKNILKNNSRINGRGRIIQQGLDINIVAKKIKEIYMEILAK